MSTPSDPAALLAESKRTDDPGLPLIAEVRSGAERLVSHLMHRQQSKQRGMKQAARRLR